MRVFAFSLWMVGLSAFCNTAAAQAMGDEYYVTIGVFAVHDNAIRLTAKTNKMGFNSQYAINPLRKLYYVYVFQSEDKRKAFTFLIKLKAESGYKDAWIFAGHLGEEQAQVINLPVVEPIVEPVKEPITPEIIPVKVDSSKIIKPVVKKVAKGKFFLFKFINSETGNEVRGEIHLSESKTPTQYQAFKADELVDVPAPRNQNGVYFVTTIAPGYKALETNINFKDPLPSSSGTGPDGEMIIPLTLLRAKRGDYIEFNDVSYYRNSVVMQPQSENELNGLADLMKENLNYKVRVHAHCNGNEARDIITLGTSTKYFENDLTNQKISGSAKELTELRAEAVRRYLVSQGIEVDRILTKGEGGKMMVYPQTSVYANYNDRVEIEIIRH